MKPYQSVELRDSVFVYFGFGLALTLFSFSWLFVEFVAFVNFNPFRFQISLFTARIFLGFICLGCFGMAGICCYYYLGNSKSEGKKDVLMKASGLVSLQRSVQQNYDVKLPKNDALAKHRYNPSPFHGAPMDSTPMRRSVIDPQFVADDVSLKRLITKEIKTPAKEYEYSPFRTNSVSKYNTSFRDRETRTVASNENLLLADDANNTILDVYASEKLEEMKISSKSIDRWSYNLRVWLIKVVIEPLLNQLKQSFAVFFALLFFSNSAHRRVTTFLACSPKCLAVKIFASK